MTSASVSSGTDRDVVESVSSGTDRDDVESVSSGTDRDDLAKTEPIISLPFFRFKGLKVFLFIFKLPPPQPSLVHPWTVYCPRSITYGSTNNETTC